MRLHNPIYSRKWTKIVMPISTFLFDLGKNFGYQAVSTNADHSMGAMLLPLSNGHIGNSTYDISQPSASVVPPERDASMRPTDQKESIYYQIDAPHLNDENNNKKNSDESSQSLLIDMSEPYPDESSLKGNDTYTLFVSLNDYLRWILAFTVLYFLWFILIAGISRVHLVIYAALLLFFCASDRTRRLTLAVLIYLTYLFLYDALRLIPNYTVSSIHIRDVYQVEKTYFGIVHGGKLITLNEYFQQHHIPFFDVFTGLCYLNWIPIPIAYSLYLYRYKSKRDYMDFACTFLLTNVLGFIVYYIIPTAPPWYVETYGFEFNKQAVGNPAGFIHFDQITGLNIFSSMYSKNANVFAAIPSLHAAYPLITVLYGSLSKRFWLHIAFALFTLCVWFSAVYSRHHYVLDVLAGAMVALTAYVLYRLLSRIPPVNRLLVLYSKLI